MLRMNNVFATWIRIRFSASRVFADLPCDATGTHLESRARNQAAITAPIRPLKIGRNMSAPTMPPNAAVQRRRAALTSTPHVHNEMTHLRRAVIRRNPSARATCYADPSRLIFIDEGNLRPARSISNRVSHCSNLIARILRQTLRRVRFRVGWSFHRNQRNIRCVPIDTDCKGRHHTTHKATSLDNDSWITKLGRVKRPFAWRNALVNQRRDSADQAEEWRYASKELHNV